VHGSVIAGGQEYSSYPERCLLQGERRTLPGESVADVDAELRVLLGDVDGAARTTFSRDPFEIDAGHEFPQLVARCAKAERLGGIAFWTDAALLAAAGIPTVVYGPTGVGAHATEEWVDLASLERCAGAYLAVARAVCA